MTDTTAAPVPDDPGNLRRFAEDLARAAGHVAMAGRRSTDVLGRSTKSTHTDLVTEFDRAAETHLVESLRRERPRDAIVGEEGANDLGTSGFTWYLDPIDGTTNFVYDLPAWSCSVGVARGDIMVAGAVFVPPLDEMFSAELGGGATRNGVPITSSREIELAKALVGTGFGYDPETRISQAECVAALIGEVRDIRRLGSAAFDLCMVACGRLDVYYERHLNSWDAAAGVLIATEAGAVASDFAGGPARPEEMLVATPGVHAAFLTVLGNISPAY